MLIRHDLSGGIPISTSLQPTLDAEKIRATRTADNKRIILISCLSVLIAAVVSLIAKLLIHLIDFVTNASFYGRFSIGESTPLHNHLGVFVIIIPVLGGIVVGLMALYGSKAIRGHGIPEAMEQILTNNSKIKPAITYLKPLSSALAIGTGGPFGAEGPIIATGGALGSTIGQLLRISHYERKILLAAGATAGMSAIFGSPIAAVFLAIELLLFEFSPGSIVPVALACITGAAGHHLLFGSEPVFHIASTLHTPSNTALLLYSIFGIFVGVIAVAITKIVYFLEDVFEKLPIHWMWWPAIGGLFVGVIGYVDPRTLGVGYSNITDVLSGELPLQMVFTLCFLKFASWAIALASGTSGGTLAPLLTIGGAVGALMGLATQYLFPAAGISVSIAALVGMSAMFAGASRALITSVIFALETTGQVNALLPLLASCTLSYFISLYLMEHTIMTEKIARRGVKTPESYKPDILEQFLVKHVVSDDRIVISGENTIKDVRIWLSQQPNFDTNYFIIVDNDGVLSGVISTSNLLSNQHNTSDYVSSLIKRKTVWTSLNDTLKTAVETMSSENLDVLAVLNHEHVVIGIINYKDIMSAYKLSKATHLLEHPYISVKEHAVKVLIQGRRLVRFKRKKSE